MTIAVDWDVKLQTKQTKNKRTISVVSYKWKYEHRVLVNNLVKFAQEKSVVRLTYHLYMTIAVDWEVKPQNQTNKRNILYQ